MKEILRTAGYRPDTSSHFPVSDNGGAKVYALQELIAAEHEGTLLPPPYSGTRRYDVDGTAVVFASRMGDSGQPAWWIQL